MVIVRIFDAIEAIYSKGVWVSSNAMWAAALNSNSAIILNDMMPHEPDPVNRMVDELVKRMPYITVIHRPEPPKFDPDVIY